MRSRTVTRTAKGLCVVAAIAVVWTAQRANNSGRPSIAVRLDEVSRHSRDESEVRREIGQLGVSVYPELANVLRGTETRLTRLRRRIAHLLPDPIARFTGLELVSVEERQFVALRVLNSLRVDPDALVILRALARLLEDPRFSGEAAKILSRMGPALSPILPELVAGMNANIHQLTATNFVAVLWSRDQRGERWWLSATGLTNEQALAVSRWVHAWESGSRAAALAELDRAIFDRESIPPVRREFAVVLMDLIGPEVWPLAAGWVDRLRLRQSSEERELTVWLIGLIGPMHSTHREVEALARIVEGEEQPWVRVAAIRALGRLGDLSRSALEKLLQGADEESIQAARTALAELDLKR